jgi:hypothetical protein
VLLRSASKLTPTSQPPTLPILAKTVAPTSDPQTMGTPQESDSRAPTSTLRQLARMAVHLLLVSWPTTLQVGDRGMVADRHQSRCTKSDCGTSRFRASNGRPQHGVTKTIPLAVPRS